MNSPAFSIVIPVFNEAESIPALLAEIRQSLPGLDYEIIMVDDGSTDRTADAISADSGVRGLRFRKNAGQSAAILAGIAVARGACIVLLDGDLQNDPADIPRLLAEIEKGADLVCGHRVRRKDSLSKRVMSGVANAVRSRFVGDGIRDAGCTLKAFRRECAVALVPFRGVHRFIPALMKNAGCKIAEIPVNHRPRRFGASKYGLGNRAIRATVDMFGVRWLQARKLDYDLAAPRQS